MTIITFIENYALYLTITALAIYLIYSFIDTRRSKIDKSLIDSLYNIAQELDKGNSIQASIAQISKDKSNPSSDYFKKIIEKSNKGLSFQDSIKEVSKQSSSETFSYICSILLLAISSKGRISGSLKQLSQNLWEIDHLQESIITKSSSALSTLKLLGIILIPLIYYFMSSILSSGSMIMQLTLPFKIYFFTIAVSMTFTDYFMFKDIKDGLFLLPFTIFYISYVIIKIGPFISGYFGA